MAIIRPFCSFRPKTDLAAQVASLPYDVMNSDEARAMAKGNAHSFLHVSRAEIDLPESIDVHSASVYEKARENFQRYVDTAPDQYLQSRYHLAFCF